MLDAGTVYRVDRYVVNDGWRKRGLDSVAWDCEKESSKVFPSLFRCCGNKGIKRKVRNEGFSEAFPVSRRVSGNEKKEKENNQEERKADVLQRK